MRHFFERFTTGCARFAGRPAMMAACIVIAASALRPERLGLVRLSCWLR